MARKLVEFNDVAAAAQKLKDAGKRPTVIAIRDLLGKGSFTTISTGTVAKLAMRQPFVLFKGLTFQKLCLP
ncbi:DNA-binding protein, partial [Salmonella sp. SAL4451]|uniref:DNA-binding protein n=1 Tax=Salmonella sp. SAL4451 TaxID=3159906 RepID=UPI003979F511